jgi:hypothetical protein
MLIYVLDLSPEPGAEARAWPRHSIGSEEKDSRTVAPPVPPSCWVNSVVLTAIVKFYSLANAFCR